MHAINNTALVAAALYAFDGDFSAAICARRAGRLGHRHERRRGRLDPRRDRRAADRGALVGAAARPVRELAARASTRSRSTGSHGGRSPSRRPPSRSSDAPGRSAARPARPAADRPADGRAARADADLTALDGAKIFAAPDDPADWPAWREALARWRDEAAARIGYDGSAYDAGSPGRSAASPSRSSGSGTSCSTTTRRSGSRPTGCSPRPSASSAASTASCSGTPIP